MEISEMTVQSTDKNPIQVVLPGGATIQHIGTAIVKTGHLYLRGNPQFTDCETVAIYAPGHWVSASVEMTTNPIGLAA